MQPHKIKFRKPKDSVEDCILKNRTYSVKVYVPIQIKYKNIKIIESDKIKKEITIR